MYAFYPITCSCGEGVLLTHIPEVIILEVIPCQGE